jgi:hypothetical protein
MLRSVQQRTLFSHISAADPEGFGFIEACDELESEVVINARDSRPGTECNTLLHEAARTGCGSVVLHLIDLGHIVDCIDTCVSKVTPLLVAIKAGNLDAVEIIMRAGASLYHTDVRGDNALHYGARGGSRMCKLLLRHPDLTSADYHTLLSTQNIKLCLPVDMAANEYIEKLFYSMQGHGAALDRRKPSDRRKGNTKNQQLEQEPVVAEQLSTVKEEVAPLDIRAGVVKVTRISFKDVKNTEREAKQVNSL